MWRYDDEPARARPHRHLQSLLLRRGAGGARASRAAAAAEAAARSSSPSRSGSERFDDIAAFERYLARNGTLILKFFLHVSKEEQRKRFLERLDEPAKRWKFSMGDVAERKLWDEYMDAYEDMIRHTATGRRPGTSCRPTTSGSRGSWWRPPGRGDGEARPRVSEGGGAGAAPR